MICKKDSNYPYPILTDTPAGYKNSRFLLDVNLHDNTNNFRFELDYEIDSDFINNLLEKRQAQLYLVIQSKDNKFYTLKCGEKFKEIPKSRMSLSKRTIIQLQIKSNEDIRFKENNNLNSFYEGFKNDIVVPNNAVLGFSNIVTFEGSNTRPLELFEKKVNPNIKSDIEIELACETIIINYKNETLQFNNLPKSTTLNNPYVYMGLQKALYKFIVNNSDDNEEVDIDKIEPPTDGLDLKLYSLMKKKMISELRPENIDEVIYSISDKIIEKFSTAIRGLGLSGS